MFCTTCGATMEGTFCGECGSARDITAGSPSSEERLFASERNKPANPWTGRLIFISATLIFAICTVVVVNQNNLALSHARAAAAATLSANTYEDSAASFEALASSTRISKNQCYFNWYCSAATYRLWGTLLDRQEELAAEASANAALSRAKALSETREKSSSESMRTAGIVGMVLSVLGLVVRLIVSRRKKPTA